VPHHRSNPRRKIPATRARTVADHLLDVEHRTEQLGALLYVDPHTDPAAWQQHGALLAALDRLRVEIDAAIRPPDTTWHPAPLMGRSGDAMRRSLTPARDQHHPSKAPDSANACAHGLGPVADPGHGRALGRPRRTATRQVATDQAEGTRNGAKPWSWTSWSSSTMWRPRS
jgi:hypothetical protein